MWTQMLPWKQVMWGMFAQDILSIYLLFKIIKSWAPRLIFICKLYCYIPWKILGSSKYVQNIMILCAIEKKLSIKVCQCEKCMPKMAAILNFGGHLKFFSFVNYIPWKILSSSKHVQNIMFLCNKNKVINKCMPMWKMYAKNGGHLEFWWPSWFFSLVSYIPCKILGSSKYVQNIMILCAIEKKLSIKVLLAFKHRRFLHKYVTIEITLSYHSLTRIFLYIYVLSSSNNPKSNVI